MRKELKKILIFILITIILLFTTNEQIKIYGDDDIIKEWTKVLDNVTYVTLGNRNSYAIKKDKTLWEPAYKKGGWIKILDGVKNIYASYEESDYAGEDYIFALKEDGTLWARGANTYGQLGTGDNKERYKFVKVLDNVIFVSAYDTSVFAIKKDWTLWTVNNYKWEKVLDNVKYVTSSYGPTTNPSYSNDLYYFVIKNDNTLWAKGSNAKGQLGTGDNKDRNIWVKVLDNVISIAAAGGSSFAIRNDGTLWATGKNKDGQLGTRDNKDRNIWVRVLDNITFQITDEEGRSSFAIKGDGTLWATGYNYDGQLGTGDNKNRNKWVKVLENVKYVASNVDYNFAIKDDGTLWVTGDGCEFGYFIIDKKYSKNKWIKVLDDVIYISSKRHVGFAIKKDGTLWAKGWNDVGQLGIPPNK